MLTFHLIVLGKLKESYWREAESEYLKRLTPFAKVVIHELKEEAFNEKDKPETIKAREAEKIMNILEDIKILKNCYIITLDEHGKQFTSVDFAKSITTISISQHNNICFILGGPLGLDTSIIKQGNLTLSLSFFTFTHQMARVFLLEQLYRAMMISHNRRYHY